MLIEHEGKHPQVADSAYVAPTAVLCGDVSVGAGSRILFGAVLTAETGSIEVGERCIVMESAVVRGRDSHPAVLGDHVLVGPHAHVNGARIDTEVFLATGVSVFPGARIGRGSEVRINGVVHVNSRVEPDTTVPIGWIAVGDPARLFSPDAHDQLWEVQEAMDFPGTVFGLAREDATMERICTRYSESFGRHREDRIVD
ncbi:MAG TPA: gamma carbonic anhydrase family protein [Thermoleophilaceae bacterium]|nr:gamma carbonic anhydrase family protein [Thermoleophilaceae bacterium]